MLNRMQVLAIVFAGVFGLCAMIGFVYLMSYLIETNNYQWAEFWASVGAIALVIVWLLAPGKLNEQRQEHQRLKEEEAYRDHVARLREAHIAHLKFMESKQRSVSIPRQEVIDNYNNALSSLADRVSSMPKKSKPIETYKFINDLN